MAGGVRSVLATGSPFSSNLTALHILAKVLSSAVVLLLGWLAGFERFAPRMESILLVMVS